MDKAQRLFSNADLRRLIVPLIVEQFLAISVGVVDTIMVSSVGESAVSGLALVDSINILLINVFAALASGGVVVASQYLGQGKREQANETCKQLVYSTLVISLIIMILCFVFRFQILSTLFGNVGVEIMNHSQVFFVISAFSYPFIALYNCGAAIFRAMGNSRISMMVSLFINAINIVGNAILIYGFDWGVAGAGTSTLVSRIIGAIIILRRVQNPELKIYIDSYRKFHFDFSIIRKILKIGIPSGFENGVFQAGRIIVQSLVSTFGAVSIAAYAVASNFGSFMIIPGAAIGLAMITVVGRCAGADDYKQAKQYIFKLMVLSYICVALTSFAFFALREPIFQLYALSSETMGIASQLILICVVGDVLLWPMAFTFPNALRASNDATYSMFISVLSMFVFRVGFSYLLVYQFHLKAEAIYYAMLADWLCRGILFFIRYKSGKWMYRKLV